MLLRFLYDLLYYVYQVCRKIFLCFSTESVLYYCRQNRVNCWEQCDPSVIHAFLVVLFLVHVVIYLFFNSLNMFSFFIIDISNFNNFILIPSTQGTLHYDSGLQYVLLHPISVFYFYFFFVFIHPYFFNLLLFVKLSSSVS